MPERLEILKTAKLYIAGKFVRTESGRYYTLKNKFDASLSNICLASRKDFRNAVVAARKAQDAWANRSAYNIGQILYRIAENLEARKEEFANILIKEESLSSKNALNFVEENIDRIVYFAGWSDKFLQLYSSVNPTASSHFNFSIVEPTGIVAAICGEKSGFSGLVSAVSAVICSGNTTVILAEKNAPLSAVAFAEVLHHSDVPAGVVNILTGDQKELSSHFSSHMDVNALLLIAFGKEETTPLKKLTAENVKRLTQWELGDLEPSAFEKPSFIRSFLEVKTTWHPIEQIGGAQAAY